jgi:hypothetical protein
MQIIIRSGLISPKGEKRHDDVFGTGEDMRPNFTSTDT